MTVDAPSPMALAFTLASHCHLPLKTATTVMVRQLFVHFYYIVSQFSSYFLSYFVVVLYVWFLFCPLDLRKDHVIYSCIALGHVTTIIFAPTYDYKGSVKKGKYFTCSRNNAFFLIQTFQGFRALFLGVSHKAKGN